MTRLRKNKQYFSNASWAVDRVRDEVDQGLSLLNSVDNKIVTFFGSHRVKRSSEYYTNAERLAFDLGKRGYAILTGGGPGIMHAANAGATRAKAPSIGLRAELLLGERVTDPIFSKELSFHFLFARRFIMSIKSEALVFYPGGFGTLNELFEFAVLMQTGIVDKVPMICVNRKYWNGLFEWMEKNPLNKRFLIHDRKDLGLFHVLDDPKEIIRVIENQ